MKDNDITFEYIDEFVDCIIDEVENDEDNFVAVVAKFDEAKEILKDAMAYKNVNFESLQIFWISLNDERNRYHEDDLATFED